MEVFDYVADGQMNLFDFLSKDVPFLKIKSPVRIVETFAGYGSQALAMKRLGVPFEHYKISEWCISSNRIYKAAHFFDREEESNLSKEDAVKELMRLGVSIDGKTPCTAEVLFRKSVDWLNQVIAEFKATNNIGSIMNVKGGDLGIVDLNKWTYIFTYSFPCQ